MKGRYEGLDQRVGRSLGVKEFSPGSQTLLSGLCQSRTLTRKDYMSLRVDYVAVGTVFVSLLPRFLRQVSAMDYFVK